MWLFVDDEAELVRRQVFASHQRVEFVGDVDAGAHERGAAHVSQRGVLGQVVHVVVENLADGLGVAVGQLPGVVDLKVNSDAVGHGGCAFLMDRWEPVPAWVVSHRWACAVTARAAPVVMPGIAGCARRQSSRRDEGGGKRQVIALRPPWCVTGAPPGGVSAGTASRRAGRARR